MAEAESAEKQKIVEKLQRDLRNVRSQAGQEARRTEEVKKELEVCVCVYMCVGWSMGVSLFASTALADRLTGRRLSQL